MDKETWKQLTHAALQNKPRGWVPKTSDVDSRSSALRQVDEALDAYNKADRSNVVDCQAKLTTLKSRLSDWLNKETKDRGKSQKPGTGRDANGDVQLLLYQLGDLSPQDEAQNPLMSPQARQQPRPLTVGIAKRIARNKEPIVTGKSLESVRDSFANWADGATKLPQLLLENTVQGKSSGIRALKALADDYLVDNKGPWYRTAVDGSKSLGPCVLMGAVGLEEPPFFTFTENLAWCYRSYPNGAGGAMFLGRRDNRAESNPPRAPTDGEPLAKCLREMLEGAKLIPLDVDDESQLAEQMQDEAKEGAQKEAEERTKSDDEKLEDAQKEQRDNSKPLQPTDEGRAQEEAKKPDELVDVWQKFGAIFTSGGVKAALRNLAEVLLKLIPFYETFAELKELVEAIGELASKAFDKAKVESHVKTAPGLIDYTARREVLRRATHDSRKARNELVGKIMQLIISFVPIVGWVVKLLAAVGALVKAVYAAARDVLSAGESAVRRDASNATSMRLAALCKATQGSSDFAWAAWDEFLTSEAPEFDGLNRIVALSLPTLPRFPAAVTLGLLPPIPSDIVPRWPSSLDGLTWSPRGDGVGLMFGSAYRPNEPMSATKRQYAWPIGDFIVPKVWQAALDQPSTPPELRALWRDLTRVLKQQSDKSIPNFSSSPKALQHYMNSPPFWLVWTHHPSSLLELRKFIDATWKKNEATSPANLHRGILQILDDYLDLLCTCHALLAAEPVALQLRGGQ